MTDALSETARAALDTEPLTARTLAAAVPLDLDPDVGDTPLDRTALLEAARLEALRHGRGLVLPEHLLLACVRLTGGDLAAARERLQTLTARRALADYEALRPVDPADRPTAVLVAGLPGCGKSTLAESLARRLRAPVFSMDWQLGALVPFGLLRPDNTTAVAEVQMTAAAAGQLRLGLSVVLDATGHRRETRDRWRALTENLGGVFVGVECVCTDDALLRRRVDDRARGIPGWPATVTWEHVGRMRRLWEPWTEPHLLVDSATDSPEIAVRRVLDAIPAP
ncbi:AAA family ATPase [Umezawaea endophytica]|uniref:AAA family ATPase n=1 Tax=Umezawaea endophytica TaxID=1654476 RepID=A0A9X2VMW2_9PSEU|nr:ATP-binding protein [Umezawaea endophytica]MCS7479586.1 AAA family ATPase [Umezawaea endophytica]